MNPRLAAVIVVLSLSFAPQVRAALSLTSINTPVTIDFDTTVTNVNEGQFAGLGFDNTSPATGKLYSDSWAIRDNGGGGGGDKQFSEDDATANFARGASTGGVTSAGIYAFDVNNGAGTDAAFGVQPDDDQFSSGQITLKVTNNTGVTITNWSVSFDVYVLNNADKSSVVAFMQEPTSSDTNGDDASSEYTAGGVDVVSGGAADTTPLWVKNSQTVTFVRSIANTASLNLRWDISDNGTSGTVWDEFAIDNIRIAVVPEPGAILFGVLVCSMIGVAAGSRKLRQKLHGGR